MEMIDPNQTLAFPLWQLIAFLGLLTVCTLARKSIGMVATGFLFSVHWVFWQKAKVLKTEGQEYTMLAILFALGLMCALSVAWHYYKSDHFE